MEFGKNIENVGDNYEIKVMCCYMVLWSLVQEYTDFTSLSPSRSKFRRQRQASHHHYGVGAWAPSPSVELWCMKLDQEEEAEAKAAAGQSPLNYWVCPTKNPNSSRSHHSQFSKTVPSADPPAWEERNKAPGREVLQARFSSWPLSPLQQRTEKQRHSSSADRKFYLNTSSDPGSR